jgi:N-acetylglucosamine-6-sulfatase
MQNDPHQINNIHPSASPSPEEHTILGIPLSKVIPRLDSLLMVTKSCKGRTCVDPWTVIHPEGDVKTLKDALHEDFDGFYASVARRVSFDKCELGYIRESEGPQEIENFEEWRGEEL